MLLLTLGVEAGLKWRLNPPKDGGKKRYAKIHHQHTAKRATEQGVMSV